MEEKSSPKVAQRKFYLGKYHQRKIKHRCDICDYTTSKMSNYKKHLKSKKHEKIKTVGISLVFWLSLFFDTKKK